MSSTPLHYPVTAFLTPVAEGQDEAIQMALLSVPGIVAVTLAPVAHYPDMRELTLIVDVARLDDQAGIADDLRRAQAAHADVAPGLAFDLPDWHRETALEWLANGPALPAMKAALGRAQADVDLIGSLGYPDFTVHPGVRQPTPTPEGTPVYIWQYGLTDAQKTWLQQASRAERAAFMLSTPLRIACQHATRAGQETVLYLPTIHGIPVTHQFFDTPGEALAFGRGQVERYGRNHAEEPITLDPQALGIAGEAIDEFASPEDRQRLFFAEALRGMQAITEGRDPHADTGLDA